MILQTAIGIIRESNQQETDILNAIADYEKKLTVTKGRSRYKINLRIRELRARLYNLHAEKSIAEFEKLSPEEKKSIRGQQEKEEAEEDALNQKSMEDEDRPHLFSEKEVRKRARQGLFEIVREMLYDAGLRMVGSSSASEAEYYAVDRDDDERLRIRLASHDPVYPSSWPCICIHISSRPPQDSDYWINFDMKEDEIKEEVEKAIQELKKREQEDS